MRDKRKKSILLGSALAAFAVAFVCATGMPTPDEASIVDVAPQASASQTADSATDAQPASAAADAESADATASAGDATSKDAGAHAQTKASQGAKASNGSNEAGDDVASDKATDKTADDKKAASSASADEAIATALASKQASVELSDDEGADGGNPGTQTVDETVDDIVKSMSNLEPDVDYESQTVLVRVAEGTSADALLSALEGSGVEGMDGATVEMVTDDVASVELAAGASVPEAVAQLTVSGLVEGAQPNYAYSIVDDGTLDASASLATTLEVASEDEGTADAATVTEVGSEANADADAEATTDAAGETEVAVSEADAAEVAGDDDASEAATATSDVDAITVDSEVSNEDVGEVANAEANTDATTTADTESQTLLDALGLDDLINDSLTLKAYAYSWHLYSMNVDDVWQSGVCCDNNASENGRIGIAVVDDSFDLEHEDLAANFVGAYDAVNKVAGTTSNMLYSGSSHGTHVAGIIGAVANNGTGVAGVSHNANIIPVRVSNSNGSIYSTYLMRAYSYLLGLKNAGKYNIRVINMSIGGPTTSLDGSAYNDEDFLRYVDSAYSAGIVSVFSAGNSSSSLSVPYECYPADYGSVVSVINLRNTSTSDPQAVTRSTSSNYNASGEYDKNISAPGTSIYSTITSGYGSKSGTSMASPAVAGVVGLIFATNQDLTTGDVALREQGTTLAERATSILYSTAREVGGVTYTNHFSSEYGFGEVDAAAAVEAATVGTIEGPSYLRYDATGTYAMSSKLDGWTFSSSDANTLSINASTGAAEAFAAGQVNVSATTKDDTGVERTALLPVKVFGPMSCTADTINVDETTQLSISEPSEYAWTWTTSNASVATVSDGLVVGKGAGTATITATLVADSSVSFTQSILVRKPLDVPTGGSYTYTGAAIEGMPATEDYTVTVADGQAAKATDVGTYSVTVTPCENRYWKGETGAGSTAGKTVSWSIVPATLTASYVDSMILLESKVSDSVTVTGFVGGEDATTAKNYVAPTVDVSSIDTTLEGTYQITPAGGSADNYVFEYQAGTLSVVEKYPVTVPTAREGLVYTGDEQVGVVSASGLYVLSGVAATDAGDYTAMAKLVDSSISEWTDGADGDTRVVTWSISVAKIDDATISGLSAKTYTGSAITQTPTVIVGGRTLKLGTDYTLTYANNVDVGTATVTVTGKGNYTGTKTATFAIRAASISGASVSGLSAKTYTGSAITQLLTVKVNGRTLELGTDYTLSHTNNKNAGTAAVTVTGKGNYTGTKTATFAINAVSVSSASVSDLSAKTYTGNAITQTPTVKIGSRTLKLGTDYTLSYTNNVAAGTATVTVTGKGNYTGTTTATFVIAKAKNTLKVAVKTRKAKYSRVKKKAVTVARPLTITGARGKVVFKKVRGSKYLTVNKKTGKVTVKKRTPKGTYTVKIKVTAKGNANYKSMSRTRTCTIVVK